jgi:RNA polymerase sigma-54 factor
VKTSLQLRFSQQLALTPQLQQSIRLLQLSTLELNAEIEQALSDNPLLERLDDPLQASVRIAPNGVLDAPGRAEVGGLSGDAPGNIQGNTSGEPSGGLAGNSTTGGLESSPDGASADERGGSDSDTAGDTGANDWGDGPDGLGDWGGRNRGSADDDDERSLPQLAAIQGSLKDHLSQQLAVTQCSALDRGLLTLMIDELNSDGYLQLSLEELAALVPEELEIEPEAIQAAMRLLQSFDPVGVGARSLSECLSLQLADAQTVAGTPPDTVGRALSIVREHLPLLGNRDFTKLKRMLRCTDDQLREAHALIRRLNPRPGSRFAAEDASYVTPDVIVRASREGWVAILNPEVMPKLRINDMYAQIVKRHRGSASGLAGQLQEARWLIKNVQQRFDTILRVSQAIVDRQRAFFSHGAVAMRPLVLREIADTIGLHESTVSRVTTQKFMLTPFGTYELKYFFGSHVSTDAGGAASSTAIRELIKQMIASEDSTQPISDSRIAELLGEQGIIVARRTVAKYREGLRIAPVAQRRSL